MKDDDKYYDIYDRIAERYNYDDETAWWPDLKKGPTKFEKRRGARKQLLSVLKKIADNSGFNTNAPDEMYAAARRLFEELSSSLDKKSKMFEKNRAIIKDAHWALFNKYDYMRAQELIKRID